MTTINLLFNNTSFQVDMIHNIQSMMKCSTIVVTTIDFANDSIVDLILENPKCSFDDETLNINCVNYTETGLFSLVSFMFEANTFLEVFFSYDGRVYAYNDFSTLTTNHKELADRDLSKMSKIYLITAD